MGVDGEEEGEGGGEPKLSEPPPPPPLDSYTTHKFYLILG